MRRKKGCSEFLVVSLMVLLGGALLSCAHNRSRDEQPTASPAAAPALDRAIEQHAQQVLGLLAARGEHATSYCGFRSTFRGGADRLDQVITEELATRLAEAVTLRLDPLLEQAALLTGPAREGTLLLGRCTDLGSRIRLTSWLVAAADRRLLASVSTVLPKTAALRALLATPQPPPSRASQLAQRRWGR